MNKERRMQNSELGKTHRAEFFNFFILRSAFCIPVRWCERGDSNPHGFWRLAPKTSASANSAGNLDLDGFLHGGEIFVIQKHMNAERRMQNSELGKTHRAEFFKFFILRSAFCIPVRWCERGDSNPHGFWPLAPKTSASANSATFAGSVLSLVPPPGLEPGTNRLRVCCSTN